MLTRERGSNRLDAGGSSACWRCLSDKRHVVPVVHVLHLSRRCYRRRSGVSRRATHWWRCKRSGSTIPRLRGSAVTWLGSAISGLRWRLIATWGTITSLRGRCITVLWLIRVCRGLILLCRGPSGLRNGRAWSDIAVRVGRGRASHCSRDKRRLRRLVPDSRLRSRRCSA